MPSHAKRPLRPKSAQSLVRGSLGALSVDCKGLLFVKRRYATICISLYIYIYIYIKVNITQRQVHQMKSAHFSLAVFGTSMGKSIMEFFHVLQVCFIQQVSCKTNKIRILKRMSGFLHVLLHPACIKKMSSQSEPSPL